MVSDIVKWKENPKGTVSAKDLMKLLGIKGELVNFYVATKGQPKTMSERHLVFELKAEEEDERIQPESGISRSTGRTTQKRKNK